MKKESINILRNTLFLYFRMLCITVISLFTSRIVLRSLGANNYGIFQTVAGIIGVLSFLNGALSSGSSRFLTFELGKEKDSKVKEVFSSLLIAHILLSVFVVIIGEIIGVWYIKTRLNINPSQISTATIIYQFSLLTTLISIIQVPYNSVLIAHENMKVFAYISFMEASLKLIVALSVSMVKSKLVIYSLLLSLSQLLVSLVLKFYAKQKYSECVLDISIIDKNVLKNVFSFSSWSMFSSVSSSMIRNGSTVMLTQFFSPVLAASRSFSDQISNTVKQFINGFRTAVNPQIVKKYASEEYEESKKLLLKSTQYSYYLMLFISLPVFLLAEPLLFFWLGETPEYSVIFLKWTMIQSVLEVFDLSFYIPLYAKGRLKENAILGPLTDLIFFVVVYYLFKNGYKPIVLCYSYCLMTFVEGLIEKPLLIIKFVNYKFNEIWNIVFRCAVVTLISIPIPLIVSSKIDTFSLYNFFLICVLSSLIIITSVFFVGIELDDKKKLMYLFREKIKQK